MGAFLLDLDDPTQVIGRLSEPLLSPNENEREGYVPNVVYSCGAALHGRELIIPYAMADYASSFATVSLDEVLSAIRPRLIPGERYFDITDPWKHVAKAECAKRRSAGGDTASAICSASTALDRLINCQEIPRARSNPSVMRLLSRLRALQ